jgi:hypothetical protein
MQLLEASGLVWKIIHGMPIEVFDDESGEVWENDTWELVRTRTEGDYAGSRVIGSANLITALNFLHQKLVIKYASKEEYVDTTDQSLALFSEVLDNLQERKLIRKRPEKVRETFKIVQ